MRFQPLLPVVLLVTALRVAAAAPCGSDDPVGTPDNATAQERRVLSACIAKSDVSKSDVSKPDVSKPDASKSDSTNPDNAKPDNAKSTRRRAGSPDGLIRACTGAIKSGQLGKAALAYAYVSRGYAHYANGRFDQGLADLDMAIGIKADLANAYLVRSFIHTARGSVRLAEDDLTEYKSLGGELSGC
jgi:hypothetical protein